MHPRSWDVCVARVLRPAVAWFSLAQAAEDALCLMRLCCGFLAAPNIPPPCRWCRQRAARCRQCDRKLVVGVQRGLAAAQLVEAPLARLRCTSAGEHVRGQLERVGGRRGDSGDRGAAGTGTRRRRHGKQDRAVSKPSGGQGFAGSGRK